MMGTRVLRPWSKARSRTLGIKDNITIDWEAIFTTIKWLSAFRHGVHRESVEVAAGVVSSFIHSQTTKKRFR
jgi:hypothetical protein